MPVQFETPLLWCTTSNSDNCQAEVRLTLQYLKILMCWLSILKSVTSVSLHFDISNKKFWVKSKFQDTDPVLFSGRDKRPYVTTGEKTYIHAKGTVAIQTIYYWWLVPHDHVRDYFPNKRQDNNFFNTKWEMFT